MNSSHHHSTEWLIESQLAPYVDAFTHHLLACRYSSHTTKTYLACLAHFAYWLTSCGLDLHLVDEKIVQQFLDDHLPNCDCAKRVFRVRNDLRAALGHLLVLLRAKAVIANKSISMTFVDVELRRFDDHMNHVKGLATNTRRNYLRIIRCFLLEQFADNPINISAINPDDLRKFFMTKSIQYKTPASLGVLIRALHGYFRFRSSSGDIVHHLMGILGSPANWQLASLPKALSSTEVESLIAALAYDGPSARRTEAIVRCALDLGLRSIEVANLGLDDIDWCAATITLRKTKERRESVLPLPAATGHAIANYLKFERPETRNRAVFVRNIAPRDVPIGPDLIRKSIRQAYARAGLPYTRAHLLRHTMASRLLSAGSPLKEVADVLRHRSLNTTLIYAKLDSRSLVEVALPWPGRVS